MLDIAHPFHLSLLGRGEGRRPAADPATPPSGLEAFFSPLDDPLAFELSDAGEDVEHQPPGRAG